MNILRIVSAAARIAVPLAMLGCNGKPQSTYPVQGVLKWTDGTPATELAEATIELQVISGPTIRVSPRGELQPDGRFVLRTYAPGDGAPAGSYRAIVMPKQIVNDEIRRPPEVMSPRFMSFSSSPLKVQVEEKENNIELEVERATAP